MWYRITAERIGNIGRLNVRKVRMYHYNKQSSDMKYYIYIYIYIQFFIQLVLEAFC